MGRPNKRGVAHRSRMKPRRDYKIAGIKQQGANRPHVDVDPKHSQQRPIVWRIRLFETSVHPLQMRHLHMRIEPLVQLPYPFPVELSCQRIGNRIIIIQPPADSSGGPVGCITMYHCEELKTHQKAQLKPGDLSISASVVASNMEANGMWGGC